MCSLLTLFSSARIEFLSNCSHRPSPSTIEPRICMGWEGWKECWISGEPRWVLLMNIWLTKKTKLNAHRMYFAHAEPQSWVILWLFGCLSRCSGWFVLRRWGNAKRRWLIDKQFSNSSSLSSSRCWVRSSNFDDSTAVDWRWSRWCRWRFCKRGEKVDLLGVVKVNLSDYFRKSLLLPLVDRVAIEILANIFHFRQSPHARAAESAWPLLSRFDSTI